MQASRPIPGSPEEWMLRAKGDLALAKVPLPRGGFYEDLCFHAQQAAEKALKSVYIKHGWTFRYVHDLEELVTGLKQKGQPIPDDVEEAVVLTDYAFEARYPGLAESLTEQQYRRAVAIAERVVGWAEEVIEGSRP